MITIKAKKHICNILIFTGFIIIILGVVEFLITRSPVLMISKCLRCGENIETRDRKMNLELELKGLK